MGKTTYSMQVTNDFSFLNEPAKKFWYWTYLPFFLTIVICIVDSATDGYILYHKIVYFQCF